jgi:hypothetical protein
MEKVLVISYLYHDGDILQLRVRAWNGRFGGDTKLYVGRDGLTAVANELRGFPRGKDDSRETVLGAFGSDSAGGAARLSFFVKVERAMHSPKFRLRRTLRMKRSKSL